MAYLGDYTVFEALFGCYGVRIFGKDPIKWRQRTDMTTAVDWDVKHKFKQTKRVSHTFVV